MQQRAGADLMPSRKFASELFLVLLTAAVLVPFLNKAFHIDDALFLWLAEQIIRHPLDPFAFTVNWVGTPEPMWSAMQNPPLASFFIAVISSFLGESEVILHTAYLIWPVLVVVGTYRLARRFCQRPFLAAMIVLTAPVFLVSATNVMCDVMLLAFYTWAVECWVSGLENRGWWLFPVSALLICAATLTKYFGISLVVLLAVYTLLRDWRSWTRLLWLFVPIGVTAGYELWTRTKYGHGLFIEAARYARLTAALYAISLPKQILLGFSFLGGCFFTALFFLPLKRRAILGWGLVFIIATVLFRLAFPPGSEFDGNYPFVVVEGGLFVASAWIMMALGVSEIWKKRDAGSFLLILWILGTFAFSTFLNWSVTSRTMLPAVPAIAILFARFTQYDSKSSASITAAILVAAALSLGITLADYRIANIAREASDQFKERFQSDRGTVWFQSHWGFQFYMQKWGARAMNLANPQVRSGDIMIIPANNTAVISIQAEKVYQPEEITFSPVPVVSTWGFETGASFYSAVRGPLPWMLGRVAQEKFYVARFR
jgi:4-amino-4-deoxy-L-arabinose transferase and related glycosyltransferases of PMT family